MGGLKIKNYDVLIVRILQIIFSFVFSYIVIVLIALILDGNYPNPKWFVEGVLLFDAKPIGLLIGWGVAIVMGTILIKKSSGQKIKGDFFMKKWISLKTWLLSLDQDLD